MLTLEDKFSIKNERGYVKKNFARRFLKNSLTNWRRIGKKSFYDVLQKLHATGST